MTSYDKPLVLRGGKDRQTIEYNRQAVIDRIKFLTNVDLGKKDMDYLKAFDFEMWKRWYKNESPDVLADETFCQRGKEVIDFLEKNGVSLDEESFTSAVEEHQAKLKEKSCDGSKHSKSAESHSGNAKKS